MVLIASDDVARYRIKFSEGCEVKVGHGGFDYLLVPNPHRPGQKMPLFDELLVEAARDHEFGLELLAEEPL
jgi:hypothetical protein